MDKIVRGIKRQSNKLDEIINENKNVINKINNAKEKISEPVYEILLQNLDENVNDINSFKEDAKKMTEAYLEFYSKLDETYKTIESEMIALNKNKLKFGLQGDLKRKLKGMPKEQLDEQMSRFDPDAQSILTERMNEPSREIGTGGKTRKNRRHKRR